MAIALFTFQSLLSRVQDAFGAARAPHPQWVGENVGSPLRIARSEPSSGACATRVARRWAGPVQQRPTRSAAGRASAKPLRVVRAAPGRMVISGRLADVCAELDRLAAVEAAQVLAPTR